MRRDGKDQLDLAHIGREANPTTYGASIAGRVRRPKRLGTLMQLSRQPPIPYA
jgi:hypothetical protein